MRLRTVPALVLALAAMTGGSAAAATGAGTRAGTVSVPDSAVAYRAPLDPLVVIRGFSPPVTRYGAGHLGVDLRVAPGARVRAAGPGIVRFAGSVAGRGVVVIAHPDGVSTEYEPLRVQVRAGTAVVTGTVLGTVSGAHRGCAQGRCLHWGARRGQVYLDPLLLLRRLGPVRLEPWAG